MNLTSWPIRRAIRRYPWEVPTKELRVTVCIGALCEHGKAIVSVSDNKVSFRDFSGEHMSLKNEPFWGQWTVMSSGDDVSHVTPIVDRAYEQLADLLHVRQKSKGKKRPTLSQREVVDALDEACHWQLTGEIERIVLRRFGISIAEFTSKGKTYFTDDEHADICRRIEAIDLGQLVLLLAGFDRYGQGHLWTIDGLSAPRNYDQLGVFAIGSGAKSALSSIAFHSSQRHVRFGSNDVNRTIYFALAAKFMAESASDVGRSTFALISRAGRGVRPKREFIDDIDAVREGWEQFGAPRNPTDFIKNQMPTLIKKGD